MSSLPPEVRTSAEYPDGLRRQRLDYDFLYEKGIYALGKQISEVPIANSFRLSGIVGPPVSAFQMARCSLFNSELPLRDEPQSSEHRHKQCASSYYLDPGGTASKVRRPYETAR